MKNLILSVRDDDELIRIDAYISQSIEDKSRSYIQKLIKDRAVLVNGKEIKANYVVRINDEISVNIPDDVIPDIPAENIDLDIVYEDKDIVIVNKSKDMVVHPAPGHYSGTLVNAIMYHRAIVHGTFKDDEGIINKAIARSKNDRKKMAIDALGKEAVTHYKVLKRFQKYTYIECNLETGRTHQIRVHMASIGHPLLGDEIYGGLDAKMKLQGQCLHAISLGFVHPGTKEYIEFTSELPEYFDKILKKLT